nr:TIGR03885 family FMN-dependent LLM class oxidoreductase [Actinomycetales bacterium]
MTRIGFHASHEQIAPSQLLADVQHAERAGFHMAMCSDHFHPWSQRQGHSGFTWSWLGAALATTNLTLGCVCAPGQRYHPAIVAQALGTLGEMFPGRIWAALGSGEALNEVITGERWPTREDRNLRLEESVDVIRRLLEGEEVTQAGHVVARNAYVWDRPATPPPLIGPAISPASAARVAGWADGLITVNQDIDTLREVLANYREAGGRGSASLQIHLSWADTKEEAERIAHDQWRTNVFADPVLADLDSVEAFDAVAEHVPVEAVHSSVRISHETGQHAEWIAQYAELGFDDVYLHFVGQQQERFIDTFAERVLPQFA